MLGILPFGPRQYLLKPIEVFEPGQQRLLGKSGGTGKQANALLRMLGGIRG
ncbi:hypothetical protein D3C76_1754160 [compost metagenome]